MTPEIDTQQIGGHIVKRYDDELMAVHASILGVGAACLKQVKASLQALSDKDVAAAQIVIANDKAIDRSELSIDENILRIIAKRAPVARDLRMLMAASKVITDIERIGDKASKIAHRTIHLFNTEQKSYPDEYLFQEIQAIGQLAVKIMSNVLEAFEEFNDIKAREVLAGSDAVEKKFQPELRRLINYLIEDTDNIGHAINIVFIIKSLDRIVDHSVNIAEQLFFLVKGEDVRHTDTSCS